MPRLLATTNPKSGAACSARCGCADEALERLSAEREPVALVLSDVIMPGRDGLETVKEVQRLSPETRHLFMSGYTEHAALQNGLLQGGASFIQKPLAPQTLAKKVREVLDAT